MKKIVQKYLELNPDCTRTWQELMQSCNKRQRYTLHRARRRIVEHIVKSIGESCEPFCTFLEVGTDSPTSDVDITVINTRASMSIRAANLLCRDLFRDFPGGSRFSLPQQLDVHLYSTVYCVSDGMIIPKFKCLKKDTLKVQVEQVLFSCMNIRNRLVVQNKILWDTVDKLAEDLDVIAFVRKTKRSQRAFLTALDESEKSLQNCIQDPNLYPEYMAKVSMLKMAEIDAYVSYGAFLHVVVKLQWGQKDMTLTPLECAASFFDNLAYLQEKNVQKYFDRCVSASMMGLGIDNIDDAANRFADLVVLNLQKK
jgi:hypothetical protein